MQLSISFIVFVLTIVVSLIGLFGAPRLVENSLFRPYWLQRRREYHPLAHPLREGSHRRIATVVQLKQSQ